MTPLKLEISRIAHDGRGIGFLSSPSGRGKAVFVQGALPGQTILCQPGKDHKSWQEAGLLEVVEDRGKRREADCPHLSVCGGCPWRRMEYEEQKQWKLRLALDSLVRTGGLEREMLAEACRPLEASPMLCANRNKLQLAFGHTLRGRLILGFRRRASHEVFELASCPAAEPGAAQIAIAICELARQGNLPAYTGSGGFWRALALRHGYREGRQAWHALCITSPGNREQRGLVRRVAEQILADGVGLAAFVHEENGSESLRAFGQKRIFALDRHGNTGQKAAVFSLPLAGRFFQLDVASFFQVNTAASQILADIVRDMNASCEDRRGLLDLCCGVGAPGLLLAEGYSRVHGVERDRRAVDCAIANAEGKAAYTCGDMGGFLRKQDRWSVILADPPRQGLSSRTLNGICKAGPRNVIYISCNPATLARDSLTLKKKYSLSRLAAVDLFPHTPHLECCTLWTSRT